MSDITVRAKGSQNSQVTEEIKEVLYSWFEEQGVSDAQESIVLHHYREGDFVAASNVGVSDVAEFNAAYSKLVDEYWRNKAVNDDCVWISRYWIADRLDGD